MNRALQSPDILNIYNASVVTDGNGEAVVVLSEWFEKLNRDFRYQLNLIGQFAQAIIGSEWPIISSLSGPISRRESLVAG